MSSDQFRILLPGNNRIGYVDAFLLDGMDSLENYALIGCVDKESNVPGIFLTPPIKADQPLLDLLSSAVTDLRIILDYDRKENEVDVEVSIKKRFQEQSQLDITFSAKLENWDAFETLLLQAGRCWLIWRGEGFEFFASFDPSVSTVDQSAFEMLQ